MIIEIMKRVELKRIAEVLWKGNSPDEKTPFATQGAVSDNGSFSKNFEADDIKKSAKEFPEDAEEKSDVGPMSIPRKICFVLSFNMWILYFLVLGWLLPCRNLDCGFSSPDVVERNLSNIWLLTNVETFNVKGLPSLAMIGYGNGTEFKLAALETSDATFKWNNSVSFIPRHLQCKFGTPFDANGDGIPDCLLFGFNDVCAFNATNGYVFWNQSIPSEEGSIQSGFHPTMMRKKEDFLIGICGDKLVVLSAQNGTNVLEINLPCDAPFLMKLVPNVVSGNFTLWSLVCDYGDKVEAWGFDEQEVLNGGKSENTANNSVFALLFSGSNSGGSIDLGCDVTLVPGGPLLLSWSDRVAMVTPEASAWERHFPEPLTVAAIKVGHFSNSKEFQLAAAVRNGTDTIVCILEMKNGSIVDSVTLPDRQAQSMEIITDDYDLLVLKSLSFNYTSVPMGYNNLSDPIPAEQTNFELIDFSIGTFKIMDIVSTATVKKSALSMQTNGETDLLIVRTEDGMTIYEKHVLHDIDSQANVLCIRTNHRRHYSFET